MTIETTTTPVRGRFPHDNTRELLAKFDLPGYIERHYQGCKMKRQRADHARCAAVWRDGDDPEKVHFDLKDNKWLWHDHKTSDGGDAIKFLCEVENLSKSDAFKRVREFTGMTRIVPKAKRRDVGRWVYVNEANEPVSCAVRFEPGLNGEPKGYRQEAPDGADGWNSGKGCMNGVRLVPYRLPDVLQADEVYVVEGEKCADRLHDEGLMATCNAGGALKWRREHAQHLAGKHVVVLGDNDESGRKHVKQVVDSLQGVAASIKVPSLDGLPVKGDVVDWLKDHTINDLRALVDETPEYQPIQEASVSQSTDNNLGDEPAERKNKLNGTANLADICEAMQSLRQTIGTIYYDDFSGRLQFEPGPLVDRGDVRSFSDVDALKVTRFLQAEHNMQKASKDKILDAATLVGHDNKRNDLTTWLDGLTWDGVERLGTWLVSAYGVEDTTYSKQVGCNWLISMVARAYQPGCKVDTMPVLEGHQGIGKSESLRALVGARGTASGSPCWHRFVDTRFEPESKDFILTVRGRWLVEIAELHGLQKSDREAIKQFLSRQIDPVRAPYERTVIDAPRTCVMVGTTNETEYLSDPTGARRFWPLSCKRVDLDWIEANRNQLWAEAVTMHKKGATWWEMPEGTQAEQEARSTAHPWEGDIMRWLTSHDQSTVDVFETSRILEQAIGLTKDRQNTASSRILSDILKRHGWQHKRDRFRGEGVPRLHRWHRPQS